MVHHDHRQKKRMNIFVIPTWYPTPENPLSGIFTKEQCAAYASAHPKSNVIVAKWDNGHSYLAITRPFKLFKAFIRYLFAKQEDKPLTSNFSEYYTPSLFWSHKLPFGDNTSFLYQCIRKSFLRAKNTFRSISLIHAHVSYPAGYIAYKLSQEFNIPYILTEHMGPFPFPNLLEGERPIKPICTAFDNAARTIAVSHSLCNTIRTFHLPCSDVIPNIIDGSLFFPSSEKYDKFTFFTLCLMSDQKGIDTLLYAISNLDEALRQKIDFLIGGDGPMLKTYMDLSRRLNLPNVRWIGHIERENVPVYFQKSHAFVLPSKYETFGIVYAEAIASGIPVIATKCGGPEEIVEPANGRLISIDNRLELYEAIVDTYTHYGRFDPLDIRKGFELKYSKQTFIDKITTLYGEVAACAE